MLTPTVTFELLQRLDGLLRGFLMFRPQVTIWVGLVDLVVGLALGVPLMLVLRARGKSGLPAHLLGAALVGLTPPVALFALLGLAGDSSTTPESLGAVTMSVLLLPTEAPRYVGFPMLMGASGGVAYWFTVRPDRSRYTALTISGS